MMEKDVHELIREGRLIEAVKLLREQTGVDLKTAKDQVDGWYAAIKKEEQTGAASAPSKEGYGIESPSAIPGEIEKLLLEGRTIEAIVMQREKTGQGLKEAKEQIEVWEAELVPDHPEMLEAGEKGRSCLVLLLAIGIIIAGVIFFALSK